MRYLNLMIIFVFVLSCKKNIHTKNKKTVKAKITINNLKKLTKLEAISNFGKPLEHNEFLLSDDLEITEFRIELYNFFNQSETGYNILIEELTWKKNNEEFITAWYDTDKIEKPIDLCVWNKDEEF